MSADADVLRNKMIEKLFNKLVLFLPRICIKKSVIVIGFFFYAKGKGRLEWHALHVIFTQKYYL